MKYIICSLLFIGCTRKTRIIDVVYNASNNELVRTKTLVKNCIVLIDSTPYRQWYEAHYALPLGRKKGAKLVGIKCAEDICLACLDLVPCCAVNVLFACVFVELGFFVFW